MLVYFPLLFLQLYSSDGASFPAFLFVIVVAVFFDLFSYSSLKKMKCSLMILCMLIVFRYFCFSFGVSVVARLVRPTFFGYVLGSHICIIFNEYLLLICRSAGIQSWEWAQTFAIYSYMRLFFITILFSLWLVKIIIILGYAVVLSATFLLFAFIWFWCCRPWWFGFGA